MAGALLVLCCCGNCSAAGTPFCVAAGFGSLACAAVADRRNDFSPKKYCVVLYCIVCMAARQGVHARR
jgi:hypothetical protein